MAASLSSNSDVTRRPGQALDSEASPPVATPESTTASNRGTGHTVFAGMVGSNLEFKTLRAGPNVTITEDGDYIDITAAAGGGSSDVQDFVDLADVPQDYTGQAGKVLAVKSNETGLEFVEPSVGGSGVDTLLELTDTPNSYTGQANKIVAVKADESGVEFITAPSGGGSGEANTTSNAGTGEGQLAKAKVGVDLPIKTIKAGSNVTVTNNTNDVTISVAASGETNTASNLGATGEGIFAQKSGVDLQFKKLKAGTNVTLSSDSESVTIAASGGGGGSGADFGGQYKNLVVAVSGTGYQGTITANRLVVEDSSYACSVLRAVSVSFDGANSGANGLDTGSMAANNWYYLYVIYNGTTIASLVSLSSTSPTLPSGYTKFALVGVARVPTAYTRFLATYQRDAWISYVGDDWPVLVSNSTTTTLTYVDTTSAAPPITKEMSYYKYSSNIGGIIYYPSNRFLNDAGGGLTINIIETTYRGFWYKNTNGGSSGYAVIAYRI